MEMVDGFERETHERLARIEQAIEIIERRFKEHHDRAQRLQTENGVYNGTLKAQGETIARIEERLRATEGVQAKRDEQIQALKDAALARAAISKATQRWGALIIAIAGAVGTILGAWWSRK